MVDFPAAHSMDTKWFAVDADGNVGMFNSSEGGAVPKFTEEFFCATGIENTEDFCQLLQRDEDGIVHLNTEGKYLNKHIILGTITEPNFGIYSCRLLIIFSSEEAIYKLKKLDSLNNLILRFSGEPVIIYIDAVSYEIIDSMFSSGEILGATEFELFMHPHYLGLFSYDNDCLVPIPYQREGVPKKPLKLENLPESIQQALSKSNFEKIRFTETEIIQPIEHTACVTWEFDDFWVDSQGNDREGSDNL